MMESAGLRWLNVARDCTVVAGGWQLQPSFSPASYGHPIGPRCMLNWNDRDGQCSMHHPAAPVPEHHADTDRPGSQIAEIWKQAVD